MDRILIFNLGNILYAIDTKYIVEITKIRKINKSATLSKYVKGVVDVRDKISIVFDLCKILGMKEKQENNFVICKDVNEDQFIFSITNVVCIYDLTDEPPISDTCRLFITDLVENIIRYDKELVFVLDFEKILDVLKEGE